MSARVTVILQGFSEISRLQPLIASLDAQTIAYDGIEVMVLTTGTVPDQRLAALERLRPNVTVRQVEDPSRISAAVEETVSTPWVLRLPSEAQRLPPRTLEALLSAAERYGVAWVAGRRHTVGDAVQTACYLTDRMVEKPPDDITYAAVLRARSQEVAGPGVLLGSYPCLLVEGTPASSPVATESEVRVSDTSAHWVGPSLRVTVTGDCSSHQGLGLSVTHPASGVDFWLQATPIVDDADGFRISAELTPSVAAAGEPLGSGSWQLWLTYVDATARGHRVRLRGEQPGGAVIDGRLVGCAPRPGPLGIDLDAVKQPVIADLDPSDATAVESVAGSLLTIDVPRLHVHGDEVVAGALLQEGFALPARLIAAPARSRIECWVSGLPGTRAVSLRFGGTRPQPTGLALEIDPTGGMRVVPDPGPPEHIADPAPVPDAMPRPVRPQARISRLRRRVPAFAEPAVRQLSRNPTVRRLYRRLLRWG